ncbi:MAG: hypothetical protein QXR23_08895 [Ignisphaera sp.]
MEKYEKIRLKDNVIEYHEDNKTIVVEFENDYVAREVYDAILMSVKDLAPQVPEEKTLRELITFTMTLPGVKVKVIRRNNQ